jgi:hypothetical protein
MVGNELGVDLDELPPPILVSQKEGDKAVEAGVGAGTERRVSSPQEPMGGSENHDMEVAVHLNLLLNPKS